MDVTMLEQFVQKEIDILLYRIEQLEEAVDDLKNPKEDV